MIFFELYVKKIVELLKCKNMFFNKIYQVFWENNTLQKIFPQHSFQSKLSVISCYFDEQIVNYLETVIICS